MSDGIGKRIAVYRRRRGISQAALAGLLGRSESWLSQVERGVRSIDRMSILLSLSELLAVEVQELTGTPWQLAPNGGTKVSDLGSIREVLTRYTNLIEDDVSAPTASGLRGNASSLHQEYQAARYGTVIRELPALIGSADSALLDASGDDREVALSYVESYVVASKLLTKLGVGDLGAVTADRAAMAANTAERLWSVADLAEYLGVPIMTVYHWRSSGYGPKGSKIGRYVRYRPADVESWLDEQTRAAG